MDNLYVGRRVIIRFIIMDGSPMERRDLLIEAVIIGFTGNGHPEVMFLNPVSAKYERKALESHQIEKID